MSSLPGRLQICVISLASLVGGLVDDSPEHVASCSLTAAPQHLLKRPWFQQGVCLTGQV